jgi:hypothetical protein
MISSTQLLGFLMFGAHMARRGSYSLVCSPREFGEGKEDENGSIGRGELGRLISWRAHEGLGPSLFVVLVLAWRREHLRWRVHN